MPTAATSTWLSNGWSARTSNVTPAWKDTYETLHLWTQIVGKVRLARSSWVNHSWHVPLYLTARGLTTSLIAYGPRSFAIDFDFIEHALVIAVTDGTTRRIV